MKKLKMITLGVFVVILIMSSVAFATSASYNTTAPTFGHKTAATGTKSGTSSTLYHTLYSSSETGVMWWVDAEIDGSWSQVSSTFDINPGNSSTESYTATPAIGTTVRLRIDGYGIGGEKIAGAINFY